ncbi:substrate-binding domain-containing protein [Mesobacillus foraminis]|uniref:substrate-binding domain-containing protein n=1 Tax=Mesobacillus foraminis TaxID=279826 RepID=UPI001BEC8CBF|nr:substrate-binding domain-containing protein [Mesobacillus foraminis]MBT2758329.1 substrate-binding domain-containing protein [Mesobacillus foraminis]
MKKASFITIILILVLVLLPACSNSKTSHAKDEDTANSSVSEKKADLILATTTSTQDSGLLDVLIPVFEKETDYNVKTVAVGTGQALDLGSRGEADVLLVHAPEAEEKIVESGDAINRQKVMYNDFIIAGPAEDPAGIKGSKAGEAFTSILDSGAVFVSRGDDSGTHKKELELWKGVNLDPNQNKAYLETGQGMGSSLQIAAEKKGYILTDRATYLAQRDSLAGYEILVEGDESLLNIYHVMQVNPGKHEKVNKEVAKAFVDFMLKKETKETISQFGKDEYGEPLFFLFE